MVTARPGARYRDRLDLVCDLAVQHDPDRPFPGKVKAAPIHYLGPPRVQNGLPVVLFLEASMPPAFRSTAPKASSR